MATNLRLSAEAEAALRAAAQRTGRSQQDLLREAVAQYLGLVPSPTTIDPVIASSRVNPPRVPYRSVRPTLRLDQGELGIDLLDRDDRL
jgi:hypothetical protein